MTKGSGSGVLVVAPRDSNLGCNNVSTDSCCDRGGLVVLAVRRALVCGGEGSIQSKRGMMAVETQIKDGKKKEGEKQGPKVGSSGNTRR
jgi:hypothetical protein